MSHPAPEIAETDQDGEFGSAIRRGLTWSFVNTVVSRLGTLVVGIVIARLLSPTDFGVFAVALVTLSILLSINELGVSTAVVRWQGRADDIAPTVITLSLISSAVLYVICFVASPFVAAFMGAPQATGVLRLLCIGVLIDGVTAVPAARLTRAFRQDQRFIVDTTNFVISTGVTIGLALAGAGAWSLAWGRIAGNAASAVLLLRFAPGEWRPGYDAARVAGLLRFGLPLAASNLLLVGMLNLDNAIIGNMLGPTALGAYVLAFNLASWPVNVLSVTVQPIAIPGFARLLGDGPALRAAVARAFSVLAAATLPLCALLSVLAVPLVTFLYGEQWRSAADALQLLAAFGAARVAISLFYDLMVAAGRSKVTLGIQLAWLAILGPSLVIGAQLSGIRGVAAAQALVALLLVVPAYVVAARSTGVRVRDLVSRLTRPLLGTLLLSATAIMATITIDGNFATLVTGGSVGILVYLAVNHATLRQLAQSTRRASR